MLKKEPLEPNGPEYHACEAFYQVGGGGIYAKILCLLR